MASLSISVEWVNTIVSLASGFSGAALGGYISFRTTRYFYQHAEQTNKIALATSLTFRLIKVISGIFGVKREVNEMLAKGGDAGEIPKDRYWASVVIILGMPQKEIEFDANELSLFTESGDYELAMEILDIISLHNILIQAVRKYNEMREQLADELEHLTDFALDEKGLAGRTEFDPRERPDLVRRIGETNNLIHQVIEMMERGERSSTELVERFNTTMRRKFPEENFRLGLTAAASTG